MAIMLRSGAVFLHIPKTGGSWVTQVLKDCGLLRFRFSHKHADMRRVLDSPRLYRYQHWKRSARFGLSWHMPVADAFKFCFVRHPLDWYRSWWQYMSKHGWPVFSKKRLNGRRDWHPTAKLEDIQDVDFQRFMHKVVDCQPGFVSRMFDSFATPEIHFVGRQERLVDDLIHVLRLLNERFDEDRIRSFPLVNVSRTKSAEVSWTEDLRRRAAHLEHKSMRRFGYSELSAEEVGPRHSPAPTRRVVV